MVERVPGKRGVVSLNVHLDLFFQAKLLEEAIDRRDIVIILMLSGFLRFRFDKQVPRKPVLCLCSTTICRKRPICSRSWRKSVFSRFVTFATAP
jgi:hypothetical protein